MNDYQFGNFIFERRQKAGLSQSELADKLGVTNKAVSKWENGKSKPTTDTLRRLAVLFEIPLEKLMQMREEKSKVQITKIVITGGRAPENPRP